MENKSINKQISNLMQERRTGLNNYTKQMLNKKNYMDGFNENYYLNNQKGGIIPNTYSASGKMDDNDLSKIFDDEINIESKKTIKEKALELESLIIDALIREDNENANKMFKTLENMNRKFKDDNLKDIYLRVMEAMPKKKIKKKNYSFNNNKNNFKEVFNSMSNLENVDAYNSNQCLSKLGEMWEECDTNICSDKCKDRIIDSFNQSKTDECNNFVTSTEDGNKVKIQDDIKKVVLDRLRHCKKIQNLSEENMESISYTDVIDLKNKLIKDIRKNVNLANLHYHSCQEKANTYIQSDNKLKEIIKVVGEIDLTKLNLEKLQSIRKDLNLLPSCDKIRYDEFEKKRQPEVKQGLRVGKYVIPKDTEYYQQLKKEGKDNPTIYKDLVSGKNYFYDAFSKTLTGIKYPETRNMEEVTEPPTSTMTPSMAPEISDLNDIDIEKLLGLDELQKLEGPIESYIPVDSNQPTDSNQPSDSNQPLDNNENNLNKINNIIKLNSNNSLNDNDTLNDNSLNDNSLNDNSLNDNSLNDNNSLNDKLKNSLIFGLNLNNLLGYILILLIVLIVLYMCIEMIKN